MYVGRFVVAGGGRIGPARSGRDAYAAKLPTRQAVTLVNSELRSGINKILQFIPIC